MNTVIATLTNNKLKEFLSLSLTQKSKSLRSNGTLLDSDLEKNQVVRLYYYAGFFVEEFLCEKTEKVLSIVPYKNGFKVSHYLKGQYSLIEKNLLLSQPGSPDNHFSLN